MLQPKNTAPFLTDWGFSVLVDSYCNVEVTQRFSRGRLGAVHFKPIFIMCTLNWVDNLPCVPPALKGCDYHLYSVPISDSWDFNVEANLDSPWVQLRTEFRLIRILHVVSWDGDSVFLNEVYFFFYISRTPPPKLFTCVHSDCSPRRVLFLSYLPEARHLPHLSFWRDHPGTI